MSAALALDQTVFALVVVSGALLELVWSWTHYLIAFYIAVVLPGRALFSGDGNGAKLPDVRHAHDIFRLVGAEGVLRPLSYVMCGLMLGQLVLFACYAVATRRRSWPAQVQALSLVPRHHAVTLILETTVTCFVASAFAASWFTWPGATPHDVPVASIMAAVVTVAILAKAIRLYLWPSPIPRMSRDAGLSNIRTSLVLVSLPLLGLWLYYCDESAQVVFAPSTLRFFKLMTEWWTAMVAVPVFFFCQVTDGSNLCEFIRRAEENSLEAADAGYGANVNERATADGVVVDEKDARW